MELKDADHSLSEVTAPVTKVSQLVCWVCGLLIQCFCMDINRCLLSFCLRQRRSRYFEFAYLDISFCPKKPTNLHPCWKYLLQTFSSCVDGVFVCSAGVPRGSLLSNAALEILVLSCQDERKLCLASCSCISAHRWEGSSTSIWKSPHVSLYKLNVYSVVPLPSSSSGPNVHLPSVGLDTRVLRAVSLSSV